MGNHAYYLGIDAGTTGTTALLLDEKWQVASTGYRRHAMSIPQAGWMEQDAEQLLSDVMLAIGQALDQVNMTGQVLYGIGIDHQGESCLIWDKETGKPIAPAINWQDRRTTGYADWLAANHGDLIRARTALHADAYFSATKLKWLLDHVEGARARANAGALCAGTLDSWFVWKLTGGRVHATDPSTASRTMLYNIHTGRWDSQLLDLLDIPESILPEIRPSAGSFGETDPDCFFGCRVPITGVIVDQQAALFGQCCFDNGMVKATYGTGCFMLMNTGRRVVESKGGLLTTVAWQVDHGNVFALDGGIYTAGAAVNWLCDKLKLIDSAANTQSLAASVPNTGGVYFVPAFVGLAAPHWDSYARGTMVGISTFTTREHIVRATLESIAYQVRENMDVMKADSGIDIPVMRADGGMVNNEFLMQFQADILGIPVDVPVISETSALGAAYLSALGTGCFASTADIKGHWKLARRYEPQMREDERQSLLYGWRRAVERSLGWIEHD